MELLLDSESQVFMIVDANNFYASCEEEFTPKLRKGPVVVLSNNDGCVVARNAMAKAIGIKMGVPKFEIADQIRKHKIAVLSSNYELYGEMSCRFMQILGEFVGPGEQEVYSVDECFLNVTAHAQNTDLTQLAHEMRNRLKKWIGLPSCVGIGHSKTQAKIANHIAKTQKQFGGVCNLLEMDPSIIESIFSEIDVGEVWGVGRQNRKRLELLGINSVMDLTLANSRLIRKNFSVVMERTALELRGISCISIDDKPEPNKQIICSRSFEGPISDLNKMKEAITFFTLKGVDKLRKQGSLCGAIAVFVKTNRFSQTQPYYSEYKVIGLSEPTDDRLKLMKAAMYGLEKVFDGNHKYKKAGIVLSCISPKIGHIYDLLNDHQQLEAREQLMGAYEQINNKYGNNKVTVGIAKMSIAANYKTPNIFAWDSLLGVT